VAIAKMEKLAIIGLSREKEALIEELMRLGVVQIIAQEAKLSDDKWNQIVKKDDGGKWVSKWESELSKVESALSLLEKFSDKKKPLIKERTRVTESDFAAVMDYEYEIRRKMLKLTKLARKLAQTLAAENRAANTKLSLLPWRDYDIPAEDYQTKSTQVWQGVLPAANDSADFLKILADKTRYAAGEVVNSDSDQHYISIIFYEPATEEVQSTLRDLGFNRIVLPITQGPVSAAIAILEEELAEAVRVKRTIADKIRTYEDFSPTLKLYHDEIVMRKDCAVIREKFLTTDSTFYFEGWFPRIAREKVSALLSKKICHFEISEPSKEEETPVLLLNKGFVQPFEAITKLYSIPASGGIDATPFFSFFYALFFGMMLSDAAYGIIITIGTFVIRKKYHLEGMLKEMVNMFFICGISTTFWGVMFGSFFGDLITQVSTNFFGTTIDFPTVWFNPINDPMKLLFFSLALGLIHIFLAMGLSGYMAIRDGQPLDALFDTGFWYLLIVGLIGYLSGGMVAGIPAGITAFCKWLSLGAALGIVATGGRSKKNIIGKIVGGLGSLYGITGYLSDLLSYSRILALGLATGVISSVFNTLGSLAGTGIMGVIVMLLAFAIGHPYNIAINALGSFVHSCRLQYVEFFGRFYQGGGESFKPFCENTKYVKILKEEL
jgi:V/A-type H+/Na+-transporting ATPase subunit I